MKEKFDSDYKSSQFLDILLQERQQLNKSALRKQKYDLIKEIKENYVIDSIELAQKFGLVPQTHEGNNNWYKVIMMDHVEIDDLLKFVEELKSIN